MVGTRWRQGGIQAGLLALGTVLGGVATAESGARFEERADAVVLENGEARFTFSKGFRGSLVGLEDRRAGVDLLAGLPYPGGLFVLEAADGSCGSRELHNLSGGTVSYSGGTVLEGAEARFRYEGIGGRDVAVTVTVTLPDGSPRALWRVAVSNVDAGLKLRNVSFPVVLMPASVGPASSDDALVFPLLEGVRLDDPATLLGDGEGFIAAYPGDASLPMLAVHDASTGLFMAAHDPSGSTKTLAYVRIPAGGVPAALLLLQHAVGEIAGGDATPGYPVEFGVFRGDWFDAAALYGDWARSQTWMPPRLELRDDVPQWWRRPTPVTSSVAYGDDGTAFLPASQMSARAEAYETALGSFLTMLTFGWEKHGAWTFPDVFPPRDGSVAFSAATAAMATAGNHGYVYLSGSVWRLTRRELQDYDDTSRFEAFGRASAAETCGGEPLADAFYDSIGWTSMRMCPATDFWRDTVVEAVQFAASLGVDAVSIDEFPIGSIYPCHDPDHPHPPGSGTWQAAAWREILSRARSAGREVNPQLVLTCEEPAEPYLDLLDGYVSRENVPDGWLYGQYLRRFGEHFAPVPLFGAVYHDAIVAVAEPVAIHDAWGDGTFSSLGTSLTRGIAAAFILGKVPSVSVGALEEADAGLLDLFRRAVQATSGPARRFALLGRMLRPPRLHVPDVSFAWVDTDLATGQTVLRQQTSPAVLASAWQASDGDSAVLLANITRETRTVALPLDGIGPGTRARVTVTIDDRMEVLYEGVGGPSSVTVTLPATALATVVLDIDPEARLSVRKRLRSGPPS